MYSDILLYVDSVSRNAVLILVAKCLEYSVLVFTHV